MKKLLLLMMLVSCSREPIDIDAAVEVGVLEEEDGGSIIEDAFVPVFDAGVDGGGDEDAGVRGTVLPLAEMVLVGRMSDGIYAYKKKVNIWECGVELDDRELSDLSLKYAFQIVQAAKGVSDGVGMEDRWVLNPWGLAGTIGHETKFDRCSLGLNPRKTAYRVGALKKRKRCISHTEEDVLKALKNPKVKRMYARTGVDLGVSQLLSRFYEARYDYKKMLNLKYGTEQAARVMRHRGRRHSTKRPWLYWRGSKQTWYLDRVERVMKRLGAKKHEI